MLTYEPWSLPDENVSTAVGAAFGTSKAGIGIAGLGTFKPELIMKVRNTCRRHSLT